MKNEFITYGIFVKKEKFNTIKERTSGINKPYGGLWGSPVESDWSWKDWCESADFRLDSFSLYTKWKLKNPKKILVVDSYEDLERIMDKYGFDNSTPLSPEAILDMEFRGFPKDFIKSIIESRNYQLDFLKIKEDGYDGMMLTAKGNAECHLPLGKWYKGKYSIDLNAWDCESIVVWNWNQIKVIEYGRNYKRGY